MAKAHANCTCSICGAKFEKTTTKYNRREADRWEEWAEQTFTLCPACEQKEREAKAAELAKKAAEEGMATLVGTPKQITWAEQLREKYIQRMDEEWNEMREELARTEESGHGDSKHANILRNDIKRFDATRTYILRNVSSASWWIDKRGTFAKYVLGEFYKSHQAEIDTQDEPEVQEESAEILTTETPDHGTATIKIIGQHVQASYPKDETFRQIVKDMGFRFDSDDIVWVLRCDQFTGGAKDRAAELANELLRAGFSVVLDDPEAREMAVAATFEPRTKLWVSILTSGKFGGWLKIALPKERDQERDRLYSETRKLRGAKYDNGYMVIPVSSHDLVEDFAQVNGYKLSEGALEAISRYEAERLGVTPATPTEAERPDVLGDILKSDNAILPDLVDDDEADH